VTRMTRPRDVPPATPRGPRATELPPGVVGDVTPGSSFRPEVTADAPEGGRVLVLWLGVLVPPLAMLLNLQVEYAATSGSCGRREWPLHVIALAMLALAAGAGLLAHREWRRAGRDWPGTEGSEEARSRFLGALGVMVSALFALVIIAQWVALVVLGPCD
jgi:hypothetical protein